MSKMKKLQLVVLAAIMTAALAGCGNSTPKADLKTDVDTLSYVLGVAGTQGLKEYLAQQEGIDTTKMGPFLKGVKDGMDAGDDKKLAAYFAGYQVGQRIGKQIIPNVNLNVFDDDTTRSISVKNYMAGFMANARGKKTAIAAQEAQGMLTMYMESVRSRIMKERYLPNKEAGEKFLAENAKKDSVVTLPSGVQYKVLKEGHGRVPSDSTTVEMNYEGRLLNDSVFDSTYRRSSPMKATPRQLVRGFCDALTHMPEGSTWEIYIPDSLAYGSQKRPLIAPFSTLIFKVELLGVGTN